jgi:hypothetical protein
VQIDGNHQSIMDQEIDFAADAHLDYWAFLIYPKSDSMSRSLELYLASARRRRINFCVILANTLHVPASQWPGERDRLIALLREPGYQTVLDHRPLVYLFTTSTPRFAEFRAAAAKAGLNPYFVYMGWNPPRDFKQQSGKGFDAMSGYAYGSSVPTFAELSAAVEKNDWNRAAGAKVPYVPLVTTGWDKRPRKDHPVSWERGSAYLRQAVFPSTATPTEIADHLRRAITFVEDHADICVARTIIIYAWNEHDEGGWLCPTWTESGKPDTSRLDAVRGVLSAR